MNSNLSRLSVLIFGLVFLMFPVSAEKPQPKIIKHRIPMPVPTVSGIDSGGVRVPVISRDPSPTLDVYVEGKGPYEFILDTGASGGVIHKDFATDLGLQAEGNVLVGSPLGGEPQPALLVKSSTVGIGDIIIQDVTWVAMDKGPFFSDPDGPRGVLNINWFDGILVTFDFLSDSVSFIPGSLSTPDGIHVFQYGGSSPLPQIPVDTDGHVILCTLDSGSPGTITLPISYQDSLDLADDPVEISKARTVDTEFSILGSKLNGNVKIGDYQMENPEIRFSPVHRSGEIGMGVMEHLRLTFDPRNKRVRILSSKT